MPASESILLVDGSLDFSGGVDGLKSPTIASAQNPNGLGRNQLAWLANGTVRDGGITQRDGWQPKGTIATVAAQLAALLSGNVLFQGGFLYEPDNANPYFIISLGGHIFKVDPDNPAAATDLSATPTLKNPPSGTYAFFAQGENYLIIQAGDYGQGGPVVPGVTDAQGNTLPLIWDGTILKRSQGITNTSVAPGTPGVNGLPAATAMDYYQGRLWYAQFRTYSAGDIVGGQSGTAGNNFRDAILNVTENPLAVGGDGFTVPTNAGNIRALKHSANLDATLGQGNLFIFTRKAVYSLQVPVTRTSWIGATTNNQPVQTVVQLNNGAVNDRSIVPVNGDLFYQSLEPSIRSLISALRYFGQWQNPPISANEDRILTFNNRALMHFASGVLYNNRLLQSVLPRETAYGVVHDAVLPLDFSPLSELGTNLNPVWEGHYEGLQFLQLFTGDFGGLERCFAIVLSETNTIDIWELTTGNRFENGDQRVSWTIEFPAYNDGKEFDLKKLASCELWVDKLFGEVEFTLSWRVDSDPCLKLWHKWKQCAARNSSEDIYNPVTYPLKGYRESYKAMMVLPAPPESCEAITGRPATVGYQFQPVITIKGWCRIRGIMLHFQPVERKLFQTAIC